MINGLFPGEGRGPDFLSRWAPASGVSAKYYFAECPSAGERVGHD
jgi:hypothetical protein